MEKFSPDFDVQYLVFGQFFLSFSITRNYFHFFAKRVQKKIKGAIYGKKIKKYNSHK
jgi:hypothetical protein